MLDVSPPSLHHEIVPPSCDIAGATLPRVGLVVPLSNTTCESELNRLSVGLCSVHTSRMDAVAGTAVTDPDAFYAEALRQPAKELALCGVDIAALGCTKAAMACTQSQLRRSFAPWQSERLALVSEAVVAALKLVGGSRIALFTPYTAAGNITIAAFLAGCGLSTVRSFGLGLNSSPEAFSVVSRMAPDFLTDSLRKMDRSGADCIFVSCADLPTIEVIDDLERAFELPVVSTNIALFWFIRRMIGAAESGGGPGMLLRYGQRA
jgi:arylmalonate decarboxylase